MDSDRGGRIELLLPYATLEPVRELLLQVHGRKVWARFDLGDTLANELWETDVELDAVLDQLVISLNDVVNWKPGSQMMLNAVPTSLIELRCGEHHFLWVRWGKATWQ